MQNASNGFANSKIGPTNGLGMAWERGARRPSLPATPSTGKKGSRLKAAWGMQIMAATAVGESLSDSDADSAEDVIREGNRMGSSGLSALTRAHATRRVGFNWGSLTSLRALGNPTWRVTTAS